MNENFWEYPLRKHHRLSDRLKPFLSPLMQAFDLSHFCYFYVNKKGYSACISSRPDWLEFYLYNKLYFDNPFLKNLDLLSEGVFFTKRAKDHKLLEFNKQQLACGIEDSLVLTLKNEESLRGFTFSFRAHENNTSVFANEVSLLKRFCLSFEKQATKEIQQLEPVDLKVLLGKSFNIKHSQFGLSDKKRKDLLKHLGLDSPEISKREKECLGLYLNGETAKSIAQFLHLSPRTVESYLHNLKCKLGCYQKMELMKKAQELRDFGLIP